MQIELAQWTPGSLETTVRQATKSKKSTNRASKELCANFRWKLSDLSHHCILLGHIPHFIRRRFVGRPSSTAASVKMEASWSMELVQASKSPNYPTKRCSMTQAIQYLDLSDLSPIFTALSKIWTHHIRPSQCL